MQPVNLVDLLFSGQDARPQEPVQPIDIVARVLLDIMPETTAANPFKVGDLVQQKPHLDIYKFPAAPRGTNAGGLAVVLAGETLSLEIARLGSSASLGHGTLTISAVDKRTGRRLADLCVYHQNTPALDQLTALALGMQAGEEAEIIKTANLSRVTALGLEHPLIAERGRDKTETRWQPRNEQQEKNEAYWMRTKPLWIEAMGVFVLGRMWH